MNIPVSASLRSRHLLTLAAALSVTAAIAWAQTTAATTTSDQTEATAIVPPVVVPPTEDEIKAVESKLAESPSGVGRPITDRAVWQMLGATKPYQAAVVDARKLLSKPLPDAPDDVYLEFSRTGSRAGWEKLEGDRRNRLKPLVLAECVENKGRFLPPIEELIGAICAERTWVLPAHDKELSNFRGERISIDLWSSAMASELATIDWLLGDELSPATRQAVRQNIRKRVLDPFKTIFTDPVAQKHNWWITVHNNWNAVCLAGVTGAALEQIASRRERAEFVAAAVKYSQSYLDGYAADGYCSEGLSYWNLGFGHYVMLAETIRQATAGAIDLNDRPLVGEIARFARKLEIIDGVWPSFADCATKTRPNADLMYFINRRWALGLGQYQEPRGGGRMFETVIFTFDALDHPVSSPAAAMRNSSSSAPAASLRDWFDKAGILIARPAVGSSCRMGVALKGGNNAENHNHNDLGSYVVATGKTAVLLDPGSERYTARTFSVHRYDSNVLNSYGHAVPVVAGKLQKEGASSVAKILKAEFSDQADTLEMDLRSAYPVEGLKAMVRTFVYSRSGPGCLTVTDKVELASPGSFGTALITSGTCTQMDDGSLLVQKDSDAVKVTIETGGEPFKINVEPIKEDAASKPTRIGIDLTKHVSDAKITVRIEPATAVVQTQPSSRPQ